MPLSKDQIATTVQRRTKEIPSAVFGGDLLVCELSRAEYRALVAVSERPPNADGEPQINTDQWYGGLFAAGVLDPLTGHAMFTIDEIMGWAQRKELWDEISRVGRIVLDFSEVGPGPLELPSSD